MSPVRTTTMAAIGGAILLVFLGLLVFSTVPRIRAIRALAAAARNVSTAVPGVYVVKPMPADAGDLQLAATTQAFQDATIYARTSGYIKRRLVDIGDRVRAGQLMAEIASPEIDQQLEQAWPIFGRPRRCSISEGDARSREGHDGPLPGGGRGERVAKEAVVKASRRRTAQAQWRPPKRPVLHGGRQRLQGHLVRACRGAFTGTSSNGTWTSAI